MQIAWLVSLALLVAINLVPTSSRLTRGSSLVLAFLVWFWLIFLCRRHRVLRVALLGITLLSAGFLAMPARGVPDIESLRSDYVAALQGYEGAPYVWGGESPNGIDCSGLILRGMIDSLLGRGVRSLHPELVRRAISLWWNDCAAKTFGETRAGLTVSLFDVPSVNQMDHSKILPGDLAVTRSGVHIMAYLGDDTWIEADREVGRVIRVKAPTDGNWSFNTSMKIVRWRILSP